MSHLESQAVDRRGTAGMKGSNHGNEQKGSEVTNVMSQACDIKSEWKAIHSYSLILDKACHRIPLPHKMQNKQPLRSPSRKKTKQQGKWSNTSILHILKTKIAWLDTCNLHYCLLQLSN